jgi:hypothetical protein
MEVSMKQLFAALFLFAIAASATAFQPRSGVWANLHESGSGYTIEIQEGVLVVMIYSYQSGGAPQWYLSAGPMTNDQHNFTGTLDKYVGGQCISCVYSGRPTLIGNDGSISIVFTSETSAMLTLPGGRTTEIQSYNFAIGDPPNGLLGEWVFFYQVGTTTTANRFDLSSELPPSANGNGIAADPTELAGCELQTSGGAAGLVVCVVVSSAGALQYGYGFRFGLDQTYDGIWLSGDGRTIYPMKGFKVVSRAEAVDKYPSTKRAASIADASVAEASAVAAIRAGIEAACRALPTLRALEADLGRLQSVL